MRKNESGNAFTVLLAVLVIFIFVPLSFMATGVNHPLDRLLKFLLTLVFYGVAGALILALLGAFLWVFRAVFADFFQSFGQKIGVDPKALAHEYKALFLEEFSPVLTKCGGIFGFCRKFYKAEPKREAEKKK